MTAPALSRGRESPRAITLGLERRLASNRTGLLGEMRRIDGPTDASDAAGVVGYAAFGAGLGRQGADIGSYAFSPELARVRAIGEAVDRYAWANATCRWPTRVASFAELGAGRALDPATLALPNADERDAWQLVPYTPELRTEWVTGWRFAGGELEATLMPAQVIRPPSAIELPRFAIRTAVQSSAGNTLVEALAGSVAEVLERDALARSWLCKTRAQHVALSTIDDPDVQRWVAHHRGRGRRPIVALLPDDFGVPAVMTAVVDLVGPVHVVTAFAASLDARSAVRKAVEELEGNRYAIPDRFDVPETPASLTDRFFYWQRADRLDELAFWLEPGHEVALERAEQPATPYERLQALVARVQRIGLEVYFLDLTPPELAELPLAVVAAIIPGTVSLATPYRPCHLAAKRLGSGPFNALPCPIW